MNKSKKMKIAALITAKSHSIRVVGKNFKLLGGKPLYRWTTDFLLANSDLFSCIGFSSDNLDDFSIPSTFMPIKRPPPLRQENVSHMEVVRDAAQEMDLYAGDFDYLMLFQPTNPIRRRKDLIDSIEIMSTGEFDKLTCHYIDYNMNHSYINAYRGKNPNMSPLIRSGNFYIYSDVSLYDSSLTLEYSLTIPKKYGYNINVIEDFGIVESLMKGIDND